MQSSDIIRKKVLGMRDMMNPVERSEKSSDIHRRFLSLTGPYNAQTFFVFISFRSEVETPGLIYQLLHEGKIVAVPLVSVREKKMRAVRLLNPEEDLISGYHGIMEPRSELIKTRTIDHKSIDIVVLPGSVFDEKGRRIGYGGGFYDRFLAQEIRSTTLRVALAFELQIQDSVPQHPHDMPVDYIVTEKRVITGER